MKSNLHHERYMWNLKKQLQVITMPYAVTFKINRPIYLVLALVDIVTENYKTTRDLVL